MTKLQLSSIISQAMFVGEVYGKNSLNLDERDGIRFRKYARSMMTLLLKDINEYDESVVEKALEDFFAMGNY